MDAPRKENTKIVKQMITAMLILKESGKALFFIDLMMPVMSGYEAARVIRGLDRRDAEAVPIIALSANAFDEDIALAKDAGMNEHLAPPSSDGAQ